MNPIGRIPLIGKKPEPIAEGDDLNRLNLLSDAFCLHLAALKATIPFGLDALCIAAAKILQSAQDDEAVLKTIDEFRAGLEANWRSIKRAREAEPKADA